MMSLGAPRFAARYVRPRLDRKNTVARIAVVRERKFADPAAPKRLPEDPLPNAAPMSAPLPCCNNTKPIKVAATTTCNPSNTDSQIIHVFLERCAGSY